MYSPAYTTFQTLSKRNTYWSLLVQDVTSSPSLIFQILLSVFSPNLFISVCSYIPISYHLSYLLFSLFCSSFCFQLPFFSFFLSQTIIVVTCFFYFSHNHKKLVLLFLSQRNYVIYTSIFFFYFSFITCTLALLHLEWHQIVCSRNQFLRSEKWAHYISWKKVYVERSHVIADSVPKLDSWQCTQACTQSSYT